ncbi:hypothetical protein [Occallatibacter riparius]|uniref:Uncharacterized protein n=1 Tax=Occallatibacter riparius TaxID=1002689 RepID=A0A9J7BII5_9BACT|nr:hypothetical protein [Occallatibacter riparius]UWZ82748.1 hypothetical protein MOP44_19515 [Occallatibacter riparius]
MAANPLHANDKPLSTPAQDSDRDGLSDSLEAALLARFSPVFMVSRTDCSVMPARFVRQITKPTVMEDDGTIYGQAFPRKDRPGEVELHYYHLWRKDCGELGHALDAEHVSALIHLDGDADSAKALYWYAAAHEDTVCDASHLARAKSVAAEDHGATVWISSGKHGSFLSKELCAHGCGGDRCEEVEPVKTRAIVNVGEIGAPMNGSDWLLSPEWPLKDKLGRSDFSDARLARADRLRESYAVWANPSKRPAQAAILGVNAGLGGAATGAQATDSALGVADDNTGAALGTAAGKTGNALSRSSRNVWNALKKSTQKTGEFLKQDNKQ